jgi:hypothetical protein
MACLDFIFDSKMVDADGDFEFDIVNDDRDFDLNEDEDDERILMVEGDTSFAID